MPSTPKSELWDDFSGGLNTSVPSHKVGKGYSPNMRNVFIDDGKIERISGYQTLGSSRTLTKVTGIFPFVRENGQTTFLVTDSSITLETADFKSWIFVSSGSNTSSLLTWMQVRNKMWGFNGVDSVMTWDATTKVILNGANGTPNVPKFRFGAYYLDRVWGYSIPNGASDLYWTVTITTDNIVIAPDNQFAWPSNNSTYVGRGDGQTGTALWIYEGLLRAGKEESIYTVFGDNPSNFLPKKEDAGVGVVSNESVRVMDGDSHFIGRTGIYRNTKRVSDLIEPDIRAMNKGASNVVSASWETLSDFAKGQFVFGSTATLEGFVVPSSASFRMNYNAYTDQTTLPGTGFLTFPAAGGDTGFAVRIPTETVPANYVGLFRPGPSSVFVWARCECTTNQSFTLTSTIKNLNTGQSAVYAQASSVLNNGTFQQIRIFDDNSTLRIPFTAQEINLSSFTIKIAVADSGNSNALTIYPATGTGFANLILEAATTVQYMSDVSTATSVTAWGNFDSVSNTNGGQVQFYYRASSSPVNIATQTWQNIAPGAIIGAPASSRFIQWATTISAVSLDPPPNVDNVIISHIEGQASDARAFSMDWQNRYWITVTTGTDNTKRLTYVKSINTNTNPDAWMPIEGYPIDCYAKAGNVLYGGSVSTGAVYRLDYGTNFDGLPINSFYDINTSLGDYFFNKNITKYLIDGEKSQDGVMTVKTSFNEGEFTSSTFSITGSGRYVRVVEGVTRPVKTLRLRLQNSELDIGLGINNVNILYQETGVLSNQ